MGFSVIWIFVGVLALVRAILMSINADKIRQKGPLSNIVNILGVRYTLRIIRQWGGVKNWFWVQIVLSVVCLIFFSIIGGALILISCLVTKKLESEIASIYTPGV